MTDVDNFFSAGSLVARLKARAGDGGDDGALSGDLRHRSAPALPGAELKAAAVLVPVVDRGRVASVLLTVRASGLKNHASQISFPGGRVEQKDKSAAHAALREAYEEIALEPCKVSLAGTLPVYHTGTGYSVRPVIGIVPPGLSLRANPGEVQSIIDVPLSYLMNPANHERHTRMVDGKKHSFYAIGYQGYFIWGATAGIIRAVYERVYR